ncbi:GATA zinc finger domain-containing protein 14 [Chrysoperla carnea]|uniref:GATA zinc finger domain-containing protein 14 n=1 Tax=Chrysoperla carnea TaxID=189513 RepID=UPI001D085885|nr:GATA zinc finger domain-containing protein 14 [Chrysoperla carnea]
MKGYYDNEGYYRKLIELQEKLRRSEEERMKLEEKFNKMIQHKREEEQLELKRLKRQYNKFLEEEKFRSERNDQIIRTLDRIEYKAAMLTAKTDRLRILRGQYETCIKRSLTWNYNNNNNNIKPMVQQPTRGISYGDTQQSRPASLSSGGTNPFQSKFIYPSTSNEYVSNNDAQYYPRFDKSNEQNMDKPTSMTYFNKQNTPSNFDNNNYGSKITSRYTPTAVQENSGIIRGNLPIRNPLNQFSENGYPQFDARASTHENANTYYPSFYNQKNDTTHPTYEMEKVQLRSEINGPHRETWPKSDGKISRQEELSNQNLPRKVDFISTLSTIQNNPQQLSQEIEKSKHEEFNTGNIESPQPSSQEEGTKIKSNIKDKIKPTTCYIVDDKHNDAEDVRILNNAYDGYYVDDESEQIYEDSKQKNEPEKPSKPENLPSSNVAKQVKDTTTPMQANQTPKIQRHIYQENDPQQVKVIAEQYANKKVVHKTPIEATENIVQLANGSVPTTDTLDGVPLTDQSYQKSLTSKTIENHVETLAENSLSGANPPDEYTDANPESNIYSENTNYEDQQISKTNFDKIKANNYESENTNYDDQQIVNKGDDFEQTQAIIHDQDNYETNYDQETINQAKVEGYANYNESENNADPVVNPEEAQMQESYVDYSQSENYEPGLNPDPAQLQEGYANYESGINPDTVQSQEGYENYEPGVNINQIPEVYGNYDESQGVIDQDTTLQYEGYDDTQAQFDPNNPDAYDNTQQQFDPNNPIDYDTSQQQFDPNNPEGYDNTQQQFDPNNPESYDNTQAQIDPNNPEGYENSQGQYDSSNVVYDETNQISNIESSQIYNEESVVGDGTSAVQYTDDNQDYYAENQEYSQVGQEYQQGVEGYDSNVPQENIEYQNGNVAPDGVYQQDGSEYPVGNMPQDGVYQDQAYQDNIYSEEGQINYTAESNNIQDQELAGQENYVMNDNNQPQMNLQNEAPVAKLTSNLTTLLDSDTSEQYSSEQQQVPSVKDESDFDFSESAAN